MNGHTRLLLPFFLVFLFLPACAEREELSDGYSEADGRKLAAYYGEAFDAQDTRRLSLLRNLLGRDVTKLSYDVTWDVLKDVDADPEHPANVILAYTLESRPKRFFSGGQTNVKTKKWNREHVWPQSRGADAHKTDVHNLLPVDQSFNTIRSNKDFDFGGGAFSVHGEVMPDALIDKDSFEPRDEAKGDVARIIFYMEARYPGLRILENPGKGEQSFGRLCVLLEWNELDPVNAHETRRNDRIHESWQGNRNPFIDYPQWARGIWGDRC